MHNYRKPHNPGKIRRATCWLVLAWASLIAAGCSTTGTGPEPLVGEIHPQKQNIYGPNPPTPTGIPTKTSSASDPLLGGSSNLASIPNARPALAINDNIATSGYGNTAFTSGFTTTAGGNGPTVMPLSDPANQAPGSFVPGTPTAEILQCSSGPAASSGKNRRRFPTASALRPSFPIATTPKAAPPTMPRPATTSPPFKPCSCKSTARNPFMVAFTFSGILFAMAWNL